MLRRVALVRTDVSEEFSAFFIRVTRIGEIGKTVTVTSVVPSSPNLVTLMKEVLHSSEMSVFTRAKSRAILQEYNCLLPSRRLVPECVESICLEYSPKLLQFLKRNKKSRQMECFKFIQLRSQFLKQLYYLCDNSSCLPFKDSCTSWGYGREIKADVSREMFHTTEIPQSWKQIRRSFLNLALTETA
jgi:hypothetical protein